MKAKRTSFLFSLLLSISTLTLSSCVVGPKQNKPDVTELTPKEWRWTTEIPSAAIPKGDWWLLFNDPALNHLEATVLEKNQDLQAAISRIEQSRAAVRISRSRFFPDLSLNPYARRERTSGNLPTPIPVNVPAGHINSFNTPLDVSYEIDLWGRLRRLAESAEAAHQANTADAENMRLLLTSEAAINYFLLRAQENEITVLNKIISLKKKSLNLLKQRFKVGVINETDVLHTEKEVGDIKTELAKAKQRQAEIINALALLCGTSPEKLHLAEASRTIEPSPVPPGLPAELLKRRPDVFRAEQHLASKNAEIGAAQTHFFPTLQLTAQGGYLSNEAKNLIEGDSRIWSVTPAIHLSLFNAGRTNAEVDQAEAAWKEALAKYRKTILNAFKEVEDALAQIRFLDEQTAGQTRALNAAKRSAEIALKRYQNGVVSFLELSDAKIKALQQTNEQHRLQGERLAARVRLIKAIGGNWNKKGNAVRGTHNGELSDSTIQL